MEYRVVTENMDRSFLTRDEATSFYEWQKDYLMCEGVTEDSYIELQCSDDEFEDYQVMQRAVIVKDLERGNPKHDGHDFDFYAKWLECGGEGA